MKHSLSDFPCTKCGKCCQNVHLSEHTQWLDRGDGTCTYFHTENFICTIYEQRPDICRVKTQYIMNYQEHFTWDDFVKINIHICEDLNKSP